MCQQGVLEIYSNDSGFMDAAAKMKKSELVVRQAGGETYEILIESASRANAFVRRIKAAKYIQTASKISYQALSP